MNIIFGVSISNNAGISRIYAKAGGVPILDIQIIYRCRRMVDTDVLIRKFITPKFLRQTLWVNNYCMLKYNLHLGLYGVYHVILRSLVSYNIFHIMPHQSIGKSGHVSDGRIVRASWFS